MRRLPLIALAVVPVAAGALLLAAPERRLPAPPRAAAMPPLARPGQAWGLVQQRLGQGLDRLALPPAGLRIDLLVKTDTNGMISVTNVRAAGTAAPPAVTAHIIAATQSVPFALAGPAGEYRLWLKLLPPDKGSGQGRI